MYKKIKIKKKEKKRDRRTERKSMRVREEKIETDRQTGKKRKPKITWTVVIAWYDRSIYSSFFIGNRDFTIRNEI